MKYYKDHLDNTFTRSQKDTSNASDSTFTFETLTVYSHDGFIDLNGIEYFESSFNPDKFEYKEYWPNGTLRRKCTFVYDMLHGAYIEYDENAKLKYSYEYKNGVQLK